MRSETAVLIERDAQSVRHDRRLQEIAIPAHAVVGPYEQVTMSRTLYVTNLSSSTDQRELDQLFSQVGQVTSIVVVRDGISGEERCVAYVEMQSHDGARAALSRFDQFVYSGHTLSVSDESTEAAERRESKTGAPSSSPSPLAGRAQLCPEPLGENGDLETGRDR